MSECKCMHIHFLTAASAQQIWGHRLCRVSFPSGSCFSHSLTLSLEHPLCNILKSELPPLEREICCRAHLNLQERCEVTQKYARTAGAHVDAKETQPFKTILIEIKMWVGLLFLQNFPAALTTQHEALWEKKNVIVRLFCSWTSIECLIFIKQLQLKWKQILHP